MPKQTTITKEIYFEGFGIHSNKKSSILLIPAEENSGIIFIKNNKKIEVNLNNIKSTFLCTTLSQNGESILTIEHLLSSLYSLGITNLIVKVDGSEIPILDGSSFIFSRELIGNIKKQTSPAKELYLKEIIYIHNNSKFIIAKPSDKLKIKYFLDYGKDFPYFLYESFTLDKKESYIEKISKARTFGFMKDAKKILSLNMALGTTNENTLLIENNEYLSELRYNNEIVKHKILDFLGDVSLLDCKINAEFICYKTGHKEHFDIVRKIKNVIT
ncbi:MAG: UDP-3-O-acyl-N-acetylglucosamine deacetylase [Candidatus Sericytochromatia bacterium]